MDDCDILDDLPAVNCQTISFYWAYKSSTIDGLEVRVSQPGIIVSILICALTFITDKQNREHTDNKYSTKKHMDSLIELVEIMASVNQHTICQLYNLQNIVLWK